MDLAREVLASLEVESRAKGLEMQIVATDLGPGTIWTDRYRLRQILVNIVANAVKFTPAGRIVIGLKGPRNAEDEQWTIDITDTGIGVAPNRHEHLFEPFEQLDASVTTAYGGHGLGLSLSRQLAEQLGGSLTLLHSAPGEGTAFRLTLKPLPRAQEAGSLQDGRAFDRNQLCLDGLRILLAEDHGDLHLALRGLLEEGGAVVESAYNGQEAVDRAVPGTVDVILMDLRMPRLDGIQATRSSSEPWL